MSRRKQPKLLNWAIRYCQRWIVREAVTPLLHKLLPTYKHKLIAAAILLILSVLYGI